MDELAANLQVSILIKLAQEHTTASNHQNPKGDIAYVQRFYILLPKESFYINLTQKSSQDLDSLELYTHFTPHNKKKKPSFQKELIQQGSLNRKLLKGKQTTMTIYTNIPHHSVLYKLFKTGYGIKMILQSIK